MRFPRGCYKCMHRCVQSGGGGAQGLPHTLTQSDLSHHCLMCMIMAMHVNDDKSSQGHMMVHSKKCLLRKHYPGKPGTKNRMVWAARHCFIFTSIVKFASFQTWSKERGAAVAIPGSSKWRALCMPMILWYEALFHISIFNIPGFHCICKLAGIHSFYKQFIW